MTRLVPRQVAMAIPPGLSGSHGDEISTLAAWLISEEGRSDKGVRQWINFLAGHYAQFRIIRELYPQRNPGRQGMKDVECVASSAEEMLLIANHLFILRSHGVGGSVLECGCFKGYSSCCLSIACRRLGYPLVTADSFAGLPPDPKEVGGEHWYQPGDFAGSRPEVEQNLHTFGDPAGIELVEGWFSESLREWDRPLALIWLDVDLWSSTMDVLGACLSHLDTRGCIFSHEFSEVDIEDSKITQTVGPQGAIAQVMRGHDADYRAAYCRGYLGIIGRHTSLCLESYRLVNELIPYLARIGTPPGGSFVPPVRADASNPMPRSHLSRFLSKVGKVVGTSINHA
jgi:hypothetical protein